MKQILKKGFTIVELTVVIILIAILAAVAIPKLFGIQEDAHASVVRSVANSMKASANAYKAQANVQLQIAIDTPPQQVYTGIVNRTDSTLYYWLDWQSGSSASNRYNIIGVASAETVGNNNAVMPTLSCDDLLYVLTNINPSTNRHWLLGSSTPTTCEWQYFAGSEHYTITYDLTNGDMATNFVVAKL